MSRVCVLPALLALALLPGAVNAGPTKPPPDAVKEAVDPKSDQFFGPWKMAKHYAYRSYYFKVKPTDKEYQEHVVIYYKKDLDHYYYWNPAKEQFWGRGLVASANGHCGCDTQLYQFLNPADRRSEIAEIPESKFQPPAAPPKVTDIDKPAPRPAPGPGAGPGTGATPGVTPNGALAPAGANTPGIVLPKDAPPDFTKEAN